MESVGKVVNIRGTADEQLQKLTGWVEEAEEAQTVDREMSIKCREYYDGVQWTDEEVEKLTERKQPAITINRIAPKVNHLRGMEAEHRTDPRAFPRTQKHEKAAEAITDAIRYVADNNDFDRIASDSFEDLLVEGTEVSEVTAWAGPNGIEVKIKSLPWDRFIWDQHSRAKDFSDAKFLGGVHWMDKEEALKQWPQADLVIEDAFADTTDTFEDTPRDWIDGERKRVKVCYLYWRSNDGWDYGIFTRTGWMQSPKPSLYQGEYGTECPIIAQSCFVDRDGGRYGMVKNLLDIQDEINHRRSKALHLLSVRQTFSSKNAAGEDIDKLRKELAKADGHLEFEYGEFMKDFGILPNSELVQSQFALLSEAKTEIDAVGTNAAMSGSEERSMSGKALQTRQMGGSLEVAPIFDAHRSWKRRVYRAVWHRVKQFWRDEKWIRVTDDERNLKWVTLNRQVPLVEVLQQQGQQIPPQMLQDPRMQIPVTVENPIAEVDVDIIIDETMADFVTLQQEQFEQLAQMYQANPSGIPFDIVVEASSLRNKDQIMSRLRGGDPKGDPEKYQLYQQVQQMQAALQQAQQQLQAIKTSEQAKIRESEVRLVESQRRLEESQIKMETTKVKSMSDLKMQQLVNQSETQKLAVQQEIARMSAATSTQKAHIQKLENATDMMELIASINQGMEKTTSVQCETNNQFGMALERIVAELNKPKEKTVQMEVGGKTYTGKIEES